MNISQVGISLIKSYEQLRLHAYLPTPNDVPTIGWGSTKGVKMGDVIDADEANDKLLSDLHEAEDCIAAHVDVDLSQGQYDALCSLIFNIGCGAFKGSTIRSLINAGQFLAAQKQFIRWNKQAGKELAGLTRRRTEETELFRSIA